MHRTLGLVSPALYPTLKSTPTSTFLVRCIVYTFHATFVLYLFPGADVIAIAAVFSVASCNGPIIPFRGGRTDTWTAGSTGTPEPQQDIATHTDMFRRQGFNAQEMIKLVACGHTMGGVRSTDFPAMVPPGPNPDVAKFIDFDTTPQFDNLV
jgi:catalase (peroxidase I)